MGTTSTTTTTTAASSSSASAPQRRLSSTELLKLCFSRGIGCDFSQNEVYTNPTTESVSTITTTTTTTTARPSLSKDAKQRLKQKVMLCFFQGTCSDDDERFPRGNSSTTTPSTTSTTTSTTRRPATSRRGSESFREEISARIRERARACFFQGIC